MTGSVVLAVAVALGGCGDDAPAPTDAGSDLGGDVTTDATGQDTGGGQDATGGDGGGMDAATDGGDASADADEAGAGAMDDSDVMGTLDGADRGEIVVSELAAARARSPRVRAYARAMVEHHGAARARLRELGARAGLVPRETPLGRTLQANASLMQRQLGAQSGALFDDMFVNGQVTMHERVLDVIDSALLPNARDPALRAALGGEVRPMVEAHLAEARAIRAEMAAP